MSDIARSCMIVNLQVGIWKGYKLDKTTTKKVTEEADAAPDAARVNKHLIPKEALKDVESAAGAIRQHFYVKTLPWKDNGDRVLTRKIAMDFIAEHERLVGLFGSAKKDFLERKYMTAMEQSEFRMGDLFCAEDYPTIADLSHRFYVNLDIDSVATAHDFRLNNNTEAMQKRVTTAMNGLWKKLAEPLEKFADTMSDEKAIFRDTTVSNLREIVTMLPELNFTNDPAIEHMRTEIEKHIIRYEPEDLRKNKEARAAVADEAREIMDQMQGFMRAFGNGGEDGE